MIDFYGSSLSDFTGVSNIDLRVELQKIIWSEGRGTYLIYRKIQFENGQPKKCVCWDDLTQEPDIDTQCRLCRGLGYFFNDYIVRGYKSHSQGYSISRRHQDYGVEQYEYRTFYTEHDFISSQSSNNFDIPSTYDKIIEIGLDIDGTIESPLRQHIKYDIISVDSYRLEEGGRLEYYRIRTRASPDGSYSL